MTRFERTPTPFIHLAIAGSTACVFALDFYTPLGVTSWVFYLVPVVVSYFAWRPIVPGIVAATAAVLMVLTYLYNEPGTNVAIVRLNRAFGIFTLLAVAGLGYQFIRTKLSVRSQEWIQSGQTQLSAAMAGDPTLGALGEKVLRFLTEYLGAQAGALFMEDAGVFRRFATYGVPADARIPERFERQDGLLGQALTSRRLLAVHDVPDGYFAIGSALGRSTPRHLLIAPLSVEGRVKGVVELGFFHRFGTVEQELMTRVSESIAVAVRSGQYRAQLHELLEETQRQAEELQAQSEELRVSNEELEEQGRALRDSYARLESQQVELEQTNAQLEEQTKLLEEQKEDIATTKTMLEAHTRDLARASRYKSEFLANMSHELRTPLNASLILARQLAGNRGGNLTPEQVKHAQTIESAGNDLLALINDVLDLAKVEAGHLEIHPEPVALARFVEGARSTFLPVAEQKGLRLETRSAPGLPECIETDPHRLEQVLKNLLSNAIKFTEQGHVTLEIQRAPDDRIAFLVHDTGIGIAESERHVIFEPFCQADGTTNRKYGGTGLGLSISRELVHLLGGEIQLASTVGEGSTFMVLLPERYASAARTLSTVDTRPEVPRIPAPSPSRQSSELPDTLPKPVADDREHLSRGRRIILIVEDDEPFARILYDLAHELDFQAVIATTSAEALALAAQYTPSAVVLDIGLPDHSGLSVLDRLKADARTRHIPVHIISVHDYMPTALSLGAAGYMLKPVKREQLIEAFHRLESKLTQVLRRVLIVEDDPGQRSSLIALLSVDGVEPIGVASAAECLDRLADTTFDCMVLDLSLPDASGFALLDRLSQEDRYAFPPVIVYTGRDLSGEEEQRLRRYSKSIIVKGARSPERLLDEVTLFLHQVVSELPAAQQAMIEQARRRDATLEGRHILLVEDDVRNIFALTSVLEPCGAHVHIARNGREALQALDRARQGDGLRIDLVLMDVMMPEMDGLTAVREIRKQTEWKKLPIIVLTAKAMKQDHEQALAAGANDYMAKPLDVEKMLSLVRVWMPR